MSRISSQFSSCGQSGVFLTMIMVAIAMAPQALGQINAPLTIPAEQGPISRPDSGPAAAGLTLMLRTSLLDEMVRRQSVTSDPVMTRVMEADVRGTQTTTTDVSTQPVISRQMARIDLVTVGSVQSDTIGFTPQARVATLGNHHFSIRKPVYFDGQLFRTKRAYGTVQVSQQTQGVNTAASGVPLVGRLGDNIAWKEVMRRMPASDAIVVRQLADEVLPKVNDRVDQQLRELNQGWARFRQSIDRTFAADRPAWSASSTVDSVAVTVRNTAVQLPAEASLSATLQRPESIAVLLADSALNRWLDKDAVRGLTISDSALQEILVGAKEAQNKAAAVISAFRNPQNLLAEPQMFSIRMADRSPISVSFAGGSMTTNVLFQILPKEAPPGPMQRLTIRIKGRGESDGSWGLIVSDLEIQPVDNLQPAGPLGQLISRQAGQIASQIPPIRIPRSFDAGQWHQKLPTVQLYRIQTDGGWLRVSFGSVAAQGQITRRNSSQPRDR